MKYKLVIINDDGTLKTGDELKSYLEGIGFTIPCYRYEPLALPARPATPLNVFNPASRPEWDAYAIEKRRISAINKAKAADYNLGMFNFEAQLRSMFAVAAWMQSGNNPDGTKNMVWVVYTEVDRFKMAAWAINCNDINFLCYGQFGW